MKLTVHNWEIKYKDHVVDFLTEEAYEIDSDRFKKIQAYSKRLMRTYLMDNAMPIPMAFSGATLTLLNKVEKVVPHV